MDTEPTSPRRFQRLQLVLLLGLVGSGIAFGTWLIRPQPITDYYTVARNARAELDRGRPGVALAILGGIRPEKPGAGEALLVAAEACIAVNDLKMARATLERALEVQPDLSRAVQILAGLVLRGSDAERGRDLLLRATALNPGDYHPWLALGLVYHHLGQAEDSIQAYLKAIRLAPDRWDLRVNVIEGLLDVQRPEEAKPYLDEAQRLRPDDPVVDGLRARLAHLTGQSEDALRHADRALATDPRNLDALLVRSKVCLQLGRWDQARADLLTILEIDPDQVGTWQTLVQVEQRRGDEVATARALERQRETATRRELMDQLAKSISQHPDNPEPRWHLGMLAEQGGKTMLAVQSYQAALEVDPNYGPARDRLEALRRQGVNLDPLRLTE